MPAPDQTSARDYDNCLAVNSNCAVVTETARIDIKFSFRVTDLALDNISLAIVLYTHGTTYQPTALTFQIYAVLNADPIHRF